ncbi:TetR family transcriptional regulator [Litoreibacter ponti]|uniref:TetR family transcriptional regulator n=1 Tax=Litoreibacter ponti TaxID=1510457 RepID=A0A2T6BNU7_9RHOB|nr:TetR/AcrR family transcriptional regulator [Litoreibacter ponti]PTX57741.1 TetR family transcriptional regulator [Litoreibacter ponti]
MPNNESKSDKKIQILNAASDLLKHHGVQALSFENVAAEADLSRQLVRYYFSDLDALIVELCDFLAAGYRDSLVAGIVNIGEVERLKFFLDFFFDLAEGHPMPRNLEVYDSLVAYSVGSQALKDRMCSQYNVLGQVMIHELAIAHPELDSAACEELSFLFVSMMHSHWSFVASLGYSRDHSRLTRAAMDRLIASYLDNPTFERVMEKPWSRDD